jgi:hypothetical protein
MGEAAATYRSRSSPPVPQPAKREEIKLARASATIPLFFPYEQRKQSTLPLKAFSNREPLRAMLHDDENRLC